MALLSILYLAGLVFGPQRQHARMGIDSAVVLVLYIVGLAGLVTLP